MLDAEDREKLVRWFDETMLDLLAFIPFSTRVTAHLFDRLLH